MPLTPQKIKTMRYPCEFEYMNETVHLEYYPTAIRNTSQDELATWQSQAAKWQSGAEPISKEEETSIEQAFGGWVCRILASWDVVESVAEDGTPGPAMPITPDVIVALTNECGDFVLQLLQAIFQDFSAKNSTGTASQKS